MTNFPVTVHHKDKGDPPITYYFESEQEQAAFMTCLHPDYRTVGHNSKMKPIKPREALAALYEREQNRKNGS